MLAGFAHGTSSAEGQAATVELMRAVAKAHPAIDVRLGYVDVQQPDPAATLGAVERGRPVVVVPLLLSAGYHVHVDLTEAVQAETNRHVVLTGALGPDPRLTDLLLLRLTEAGLTNDDVVVLAVAGSSDARAVADCHVVRAQLAALLGREVSVGFLSAASPRLPDAVAAARDAHPGRRIVVSSYLLAPGYFQSLVEVAGADAVTGPLLTFSGPAPEQLVAVVASRYQNALAPQR
ncbi:sirohydrochlorin ferrochelatase [Cryobacterium psychrophilum]|nr:sirohydrochlorin ferrochelatase [Cryobacterium psychrophilum]